MSIISITDTRQYLTFQLGEEVFGLDVSHVREILEFTTVTKVPKTPDYMRGVINLRGSVVPVLDMRLKFGLTRTEKTVNTCIIVVEVSFEDEQYDNRRTGRFGPGGVRTGAGADRADAQDRHPTEDGVYQRHG